MPTKITTTMSKQRTADNKNKAHPVEAQVMLAAAEGDKTQTYLNKKNEAHELRI